MFYRNKLNQKWTKDMTKIVCNATGLLYKRKVCINVSIMDGP